MNNTDCIAFENEARKRLDAIWDSKPHKIDWGGFENALRDILSSGIDPLAMVTLVGHAVAAYTGRGNPMDLPEPKTLASAFSLKWSH